MQLVQTLCEVVFAGADGIRIRKFNCLGHRPITIWGKGEGVTKNSYATVIQSYIKKRIQGAIVHMCHGDHVTKAAPVTSVPRCHTALILSLSVYKSQSFKQRENIAEQL